VTSSIPRSSRGYRRVSIEQAESYAGLDDRKATADARKTASTSQSEPFAPITVENREGQRTRAKIPENAGPRGTVFARVRGCSLVCGPQMDRSGSTKGPQKGRSHPRVDGDAMSESPEIEFGGA
jgi:hypothetical protein